MKKSQVISLLVIFLILIGFWVSFLLYNSWPALTGQRVVLDTLPVDPFDPIRGQYISINYEVSRLPSNYSDDFDFGDKVYVVLGEDEGGIWRPEDFVKTKPSEGVFIRGKFSEGSDIEFGIEEYFFERNADFPTQNITVLVAVASSGRAGIIDVLQNGEPVKIDTKDFSWRA